MEQLYLPVSFVIGLVVFGLVSRWYLEPLLLRLSPLDALTPLLLVHALRYVGLAFLLPGVTAVALDPMFAFPAALGDLLASFFALIALLALRSGMSFGLTFVWLFNIFGTVDLVNALYRGFEFVQPWELGAAYFVPTVIVPALLVTHYVIFRILLRK